MKKLIWILLFACSSLVVVSQPYKNAQLPVEQRVADLLSRMTAEEKFWQLFMIPGEVKSGEEQQYKHGIFGFQVSASGQTSNATGQMLQYNATENARELALKINRQQQYFITQSRLGIPIIPFDEALHGLVRAGATAFPQSIGLAATWDTALMRSVATAIGTEAKARGIRQVLSPVINLANDVRWGRVEETYGEDPWLSAQMGVAFMQPIEQMGVVTTPKHLLANVGDGGRDSYPIYWSEWFLRQTHLLPFQEAFAQAGTRSVMTSYNSVNGQPATANNWILNQWLKKEQGFKGFVISDASAVGGANVLHMTGKDYPQSSALSIQNGLDVIFQTDYAHYKLFMPPFLDGSIDTAIINAAVRRVLRIKFELGLFEHPYVDENAVAHSINIARHKSIAREAAVKSFVLLKNEGMLPLKKLQRLAVIGEDAIAARLGGYSGPGNGKVSILEGLQEALKGQSTVRFAPGYSRSLKEWTVVPSAFLSHQNAGKKGTGLHAAYFDNMELNGKPVVERADAQVDFHWTLYAPDAALQRDFFAVRWTGEVTSDVTDSIAIGLDGNDGCRLYLNDVLHIDAWEKSSYHTLLKPYAFTAGKSVRVRIEFKEPVGNGHIRLIWNKDVQNHWQQLQQEALLLAQNSDAIVVVAGIHEGEFQDRAYLNLDCHQEELIEALATTGKPVTVLLVGGSAITMQRWLHKVQSVMMLWYPGEEGGYAVADVLLGKRNPAGRLPITFPVHESQLPLSYWHLPTGRGDDYHNLSGEPLFPFGYGLSYTSFTYSNLQLSSSTIKAGETAELSVDIRNTGTMDGDEVVQLYIRDELASLARPVMELKAFERITLRKGESKTVRFRITPAMLSMIQLDGNRVLEPGDFRLMLGTSSKDLRLKTTLRVTD